MPAKDIYYSDKYADDKYEYRHVFLPKDMVDLVPKTHLMTESEWRGIGVQQSRGWVHYMIHEPEPHVLLFKRALPSVQKMDMDGGGCVVGQGGRGDATAVAQ